jgi:hypothetical protein
MQCQSCGEDKPTSLFSPHSRGLLRKDCKPCRATSQAAARYGVSIGDIEALAEKQGHSCAICGTHKDDIVHASFKYNPLVIDHDHATGAVRGLLCSTCNNMLGHAKDDVNLLANAIAYLTS